MVGNSTYYNASYTASTIKNIWLEKGTFVRIKDNITYEWTLLNTENATNEQGSYLPNSGWTTGTGEDSAGWTISESGYYGFIFKLASGNGTLDFTNKDLLDYFEIITPNSPQ